MQRHCALGKALAETVSFRTWADNFAVVIREQESVYSDLGECGGSCVQKEGWQAQAMLAEQAYFQEEPKGLIRTCRFITVVKLAKPLLHTMSTPLV